MVNVTPAELTQRGAECPPGNFCQSKSRTREEEVLLFGVVGSLVAMSSPEGAR